MWLLIYHVIVFIITLTRCHIYIKNKPPLCLYVFLINIALMTDSLIHYTLLLANWRWNSIQWTYSVHQLQLSIVRLGLRSIMWVWWQWEKRREQGTWWPYLVYSSFCGGGNQEIIWQCVFLLLKIQNLFKVS